MATNSAREGPRKKVKHALKHRQHLDPAVPSIFLALKSDVVQQQLDRSLALALDAVGFDAAEPLAMESFRGLVEEYMSSFLDTVHRSMNSARRNVPVPLDFQVALASKNLTFRSLLPHLDPPVYDSTTPKHPVLSSKSEILPPLHALKTSEGQDSGEGNDETVMTAKQEATLSRILAGDGRNGPQANGTNAAAQGQIDRDRQPPSIPHIPRSFPPLPSEHTYRSKAVFPARENDPQRVRERATEESRLGEEALRRLAAKQAELRKAREEREDREKAQEKQGLVNGVNGRSSKVNRKKAEREATAGDKRKLEALFKTQADDMFKSIMSSVGGSEDASTTATIVAATDKDKDWNGGLNEPVNAERVYWRQVPRRSTANG